MSPKLTIGIPHLDRTDMLRRAIESCLRQTVPVHVVVADQGHTQATHDLLSAYQVEHLHSTATCLQENWEQAARACDTPYFSWLQDDDVLAPTYAARVCAAFEQFPNALHWQARLACTTETNLAWWCLANGPWLPMDMMHGRIDQWNGSVLVPAAYLSSWALSPAVAFRCGEAFNAALSCMPLDCPIFSERLILAEMGSRGPFVADPMVAGYWMQHDENESRNQHKDQPRQTTITIHYLDKMMDTLPSTWENEFLGVGQGPPAPQVIGWYNQLQQTAKREAGTKGALHRKNRGPHGRKPARPHQACFR